MSGPNLKWVRREVAPVSLGFVNAFLVTGAQGLVVVDTGTTGSAPKIVSAIEALGFTPRHVALILLTHAHLDHIGSVRALKTITGAQVAIHRSDAPYLREGKSAAVVPVSLLGWLLRLMTRMGPQAADGVDPDILIDEELDLNAFDIQGKVIATPGHTAGSVSVLLDGGSCLVGDLIMAFRRPGYPFFVQDKGLLRQSLLKVIYSGAKEIYPSHGHAYSIDAVRRTVR
jgi:hydroxyacylglutathione hydrolase